MPGDHTNTIARTTALPSGACIAPPRASGLISDPQSAKRWATVQAQAMWFYGITLRALEDDHGAPLIVASIHALTRSFGSLAEVEGWLAALEQPETERIA